MNDQIKKWIDFLTAEQFYGTAILKFEAGRVVQVKEEVVCKPHELSKRMEQ